ncbi:MAG TPA: preprotein translocase subunit SecA [Burkholderiales bacterium]|nr:preprotein translocase subunit SecA [Burkholderiales bacterium]
MERYPERDFPREGALDRALARLQYYAGKASPGARRLPRIVPAVAAAARELEGLDARALRERAAALRPRLRRDGFTLPLAAQAFALIRAASGAVSGLRHFDVQLIGGWAMLNGRIAEMETGEGKTLTATLAAGAAALAGHAVHVITVNDYLAGRDAQAMRPVYEALGLSVGCILHELDPAARQAQYRRDIVYCSNKELTFDYLRDRLVLGGKPRPIADRIDALAGGTRAQRLLLRGLQFAIVDEADSVLIDEARTPLILSAPGDASGEVATYRQALELAHGLGEDDFERGDTHVELTAAGEAKLAELAAPLGGIWSGPRRRNRLVLQALTALHVFQVDKHYLVRDGKVQIIDEYTGRLMPDRSWEQGLHQLIELKEGCEVTAQRETLARISYQTFFRRYLRVAGMTGTAAEVAAELWDVYRLRVARIPTNRPVRRIHFPDRVFATQDEKWRAVLEAVRGRHASGQPVLIGTRSVAASEHLAGLLEGAGLAFQLLNARQDGQEAEIVARAGEPGRITVATNMAGRGTDIKLAAGIAEKGGLHVLCTERHDAGRIDRQLFGRCGRQGDPGSCEAILALGDDLVTDHLPHAAGALARWRALPSRLGALVIGVAQWNAQRAHSATRRQLLGMDEQLGDQLAFSGRPE